MQPTRSTAMAVVLLLPFQAGCLSTDSSGPPGDDEIDESSDFLVFVSERRGARNLYRVDTDGLGLRQLTGGPADDSNPDCSAEGSRVVFESVGREGPQADLYILTPNAILERLTVRQGSGQDDRNGAWGPNGERIAFLTSGRTRFGEAENRVAIMDDDGTDLHGVGDDLTGVSLDWSFLGEVLAVATDVSSSGQEDVDLVRTDTDGESVQPLADDSSLSETHPSWSGSSNGVVFAAGESGGGNVDIYTVAGDGSDLRRLTTHSAVDDYPTWSPDGSRVAFASARSGNLDIYVMDADGSNLRRVTDDPAADLMPTFCAR